MVDINQTDDEMTQALIARTKESYDRKDGETSNKYFIETVEIPFWRPATTTGKPHIIDIIPFKAGPNFPTKVSTPIREGMWAYVLELWIHKNVGPGKVTVVCPARNYGNRCCVCEEVDIQTQGGVEFFDIPYRPTQECAYNVLVMTNAETEAEGIRVWDVSRKYSEKAIAPLAIDRDGGYIPFASLKKGIGRSIAFDVGKDKYKTISGHRLMPRDYDIPPEYAQEAFQLDTLIKIYTYEQLCVIMWGSEGKPASAPPAQQEAAGGAPAGQLTQRRSLRGGAGDGAAQTETAAGKPSLVGRTAQEIKCPFGAKFGEEFEKFGECTKEKCDCFQKCAEAKDKIDYANRPGALPDGATKVDNPAGGAAAASPAPTGGRRLLRRNS